MEIEDLENSISDLEDCYAIIEDTINSVPEVHSKSSNVLENILDGIQFYINELTWQLERLEVEEENNDKF